MQAKCFGLPAISLRVWLFAYAVALFPFISTVTGASFKLAGFEIWKYLWMLWLLGFATYALSGKWPNKPIRRTEALLWLFILFMVIFAPSADHVIDPWKNWFFSVIVVAFFHFIAMAKLDELRMMIQAVLGLWWIYAATLLFYALSAANYPGSIQHQFFLSGMLGLVAGLLLAGRTETDRFGPGRGLNFLFLVSTLANIFLNLTITETRSVFPFSLALVGVAGAWLLGSSRPVPRSAQRLGVPLAMAITLLPLAHLSGAMGNLLNELTYPIFGKLRTVESKSGREVSFRLWGEFVADNVRLFAPINRPFPQIKQEADKSNTPLFGLSEDQMNDLKSRGRESQKTFLERQKALGVELADSKVASERAPLARSGVSPAVVEIASDIVPERATPRGAPLVQGDSGSAIKVGADGNAPPTKMVASVPTTLEGIAITSSHNQWLDAAARGGLIYALLIACAFCYVAWLICNRLSLTLTLPVFAGYWGVAVAWGLASHFDDEHWLYHIPYLTLFFVPVIAAAVRVPKRLLGSPKA